MIVISLPSFIIGGLYLNQMLSQKAFLQTLVIDRKFGEPPLQSSIQLYTFDILSCCFTTTETALLYCGAMRNQRSADRICRRAMYS